MQGYAAPNSQVFVDDTAIAPEGIVRLELQPSASTAVEDKRIDDLRELRVARRRVIDRERAHAGRQAKAVAKRRKARAARKAQRR